MTLADVLLSVWKQAMADESPEVEVEGRRYPVDRTRGKHLRVVALLVYDQAIEGIEQNPETSSRWAKLAKEGQRIMQFSCRGRYFANVGEGRLTRYPAWKALGLPE